MDSDDGNIKGLISNGPRIYEAYTGFLNSNRARMMAMPSTMTSSFRSPASMWSRRLDTMSVLQNGIETTLSQLYKEVVAGGNTSQTH